MKNSNYIKKYADFYLSKYLVTKKKFEDILKKKLSKDLFQKKISKEEYDMYLKNLNLEIDYYEKLGLFNEKILIKNKVESYIKKGYSTKKIQYYLIQNKFCQTLIHNEIKKIQSDSELNEKIIKKFLEKKLNSLKYKKGKLSNTELYNKLKSDLIRNGFDYNDSKSILDQYFYNE